jgi:hypothetical protein
MSEKWKEWDLRLFAEKQHLDESVTNDDWRLHIKGLSEGQQLEWNRHGGFYHSPYDGSCRFTFLGADNTVRLKVARETEEEINLDVTDEWCSGWYEEGEWRHRVTVSIIGATYSVSELPDGVRTMQQQDHDAWEYAVRNGLI